MSDPVDLVAESVRAYAKAHRGYEQRHGEIFNHREQQRLLHALKAALDQVAEGPPRRVLDLGCGTGNLTAHLLDLGQEVVAADVSPEFLALVEQRFAGRPVQTVRIGGLDLREFEDRSFDLVAAYSVLHHVPDYVEMVRELHRTTRPGGIIYLDHERSERYWAPDAELRAFHEALDAHRHPGWWHPTRKRWQRYIMPSKYVFAVRQKIDPLFWLDEGDIHVWPADHIEWPRVEAALTDAGAEIAHREDYLLFERDYPPEIYAAYRDRCSDTRLLSSRRTLP